MDKKNLDEVNIIDLVFAESAELLEELKEELGGSLPQPDGLDPEGDKNGENS